MDYTVWLAGLKAGDQVIVKSYPSYLALEEVTRITPKGYIVVGNKMFKSDGFQRGSGGFRLAKPTPEAIDEINRRAAVCKLSKMSVIDWNRCTPKQVQAVLAIIEDGQKSE